MTVDDQLKPRTLTINLTPRARGIIEQVREDTGVPNTEAMVRILEWFAELPVKLRLAVLNRDQETQRELVRAVLSDMAALAEADPSHPQPVPASIEQATRIIRVMADHIERISLGRSNAAAPPKKKK